MANSINSQTSGTGGLISTASGTNGILQIKSNTYSQLASQKNGQGRCLARRLVLRAGCLSRGDLI